MATNASGLQILVVGGGLAGLAAASFLRKQHQVTVLERSKLDYSRNDYAISVAPNTQRLLLEQGMEMSNLEAAVLNYIWRCDADGTLISETLSESVARLGAASIFTRRSRLQAELQSLATGVRQPGNPARIIDEVRISAVDVAEGKITTESGETYRGDLIIGADGINSAVRDAVLSAKLGPVDVSGGGAAVPSGLVVYLCTVPRAGLRDDSLLAFQTREKSGMACFYGRDPRTRVFVFPADANNFQIAAYYPEDGWVEHFAQARSSIIKDVSVERTLQDFVDFHPSIQKLFISAATRDVWRIRDLDRLSDWQSGKAILIGDAAHAVTPHFGTGCNTAIEDGEALGYFFRDITSAAQIPAALQSFKALRMPRAHIIQFASRHVGERLSEEERENAGQFDLKAFVAKTSGYTSAEDAWKALGVGH
ncbi:FAD/NAD(P)-binding domain-containing protein [Mycena venus]|uniref:FAD/NAD(P)-binding domain-containing protein n=1 Tax=Mycena venus TaxID=2733690 RepID=A0A8H6Z1I7_9AGAR|nr:FAD/NAD(P)-binding domain-containing protein [Mycena venus]